MTLVKDEGLTVNLTEFEKLTVKTISPPLEDYLKAISKTGDTCYNWNIVKPLLVYKLERVLDDFMETVTENGDVSAPTASEFTSTKERLAGLLNGFYRAPFTVQRLLELLLEPNKHYRKFDKYARGLEKVLSVVTTVDPFPKKSPSLLPNTVLNGNGLMRTVSEDFGKKPKPLMNGEMENKPEDCKKRSNVTEERSPKRARVHDSSEDETMISETTMPDENSHPDSQDMDESGEKLNGSQPHEELSTAQADSPDVTETPNATAMEPDEAPAESDPAKTFPSNNHTNGEGSPTEEPVSTTSPLQEDEVDQTTPDKVDSSSLSAILSDHPSDHGREG